MRQRYYFGIEDLLRARGDDPAFAFAGKSPDAFATALQQALREPSLFHRWRAAQPDPDAVDDTLGACDPAAAVDAQQADLHTDVEIVTSLPHAVLKHRLALLVGRHWTLRDVRAA